MAKNPKRLKAYEIYKDSNGEIDLVSIATQLKVPDGTVRGWKSKDKWDVLLSGTFHIEKVEQEIALERSEEKEIEVEETAEEENKSYSWIDVERDYITDISNKPISLVNIGKKYNIPKQTVFDYSRKNNWSEKRKAYKEKTIQKIIDKDSGKDATRITRILNTADKLMDKLERSIDELDSYMVAHKSKKKVTVKIVDPITGRPIGDKVEEEEVSDLRIEQGIIDKQGLQQVANSLKNVKDVYGVLKNIEEQDARIASMKSKTNDNDEENETGVVVLAPVLEDGGDDE